MKVLLLSDQVLDHIYNNSLQERMSNIDFIISCGDLPSYYLEFIATTLNKPLFYVMGNHNKTTIYSEKGIESNLPEGCINLDQKIIKYKGIILMGLEGSIKYGEGNYQYTDTQMCWKINKLKPRLIVNKIFNKRYLDILVTHAPPYKIHDKEDLCHRGFKCFTKFIKDFRPKYLIHGHIHIYGTEKNWLTVVNSTKVINAYGYRIIEI